MFAWSRCAAPPAACTHLHNLRPRADRVVLDCWCSRDILLNRLHFGPVPDDHSPEGARLMRLLRGWVIVCSSVLFLTTCDSVSVNRSGVPSCAAKPAGGLVATFKQPVRQENKYYWIAITNQPGIDDAINHWHGGRHATIPDGVLVCQRVAWNCGWSWYEDPQTVRIQDVSVEICDGGPPLSQPACVAFAQNSIGYFCPFNATMVELRDCRTDPNCPIMSQ